MLDGMETILVGFSENFFGGWGCYCFVRFCFPGYSLLILQQGLATKFHVLPKHTSKGISKLEAAHQVQVNN